MLSSKIKGMKSTNVPEEIRSLSFGDIEDIMVKCIGMGGDAVADELKHDTVEAMDALREKITEICQGKSNKYTMALLCSVANSAIISVFVNEQEMFGGE